MKLAKILIILGAVAALLVGLVLGIALKDDSESTSDGGSSTVPAGAMVCIFVAINAARKRKADA